MWRTASISFISAVVGGLIVFGAITAVSPGARPSITTTTEVTKPPRSSLSAEQIYKQFSPTVVHVRAVFTGESRDIFGVPIPEQGEAQGSGFIIDSSGLAVTNAHVVDKASSVTITLEDGTQVDAEVLGSDRSTDVALLKFSPEGKKLKTISLGDSSAVEVGDTVFAIGNPFGFDRSMTEGIVSALGRQITAPSGFAIRNVIQTDAAVNPGNSGGPLIDAQGKVIGVTAQIASQTEEFAGIAFAIPSNTVKEVTKQLREKGKASHPWLGIQGQDITADMRKVLKLPAQAGVLIVEVIEGSPAAKAGLRGGDTIATIGGQRFVVGGDVLTKLDETRVTSMDQLLGLIEARRVGDTVTVEFIRDGKTTSKRITLGERPEEVTR